MKEQIYVTMGDKVNPTFFFSLSGLTVANVMPQ